MQNRYFMLLLLYDFLLSMSDIIQKARCEPEPRPEQVAGDLVNVRGVESACCCELNWLELIRRRAWTVYEVGNYIRWNGKIKTWKPLFFLFIFYSANQLCQLCGKWFKMDTRAVFYLQHCLLSLPGTKNPASTGSDEFYMCSGFGLNIKRTGHGQQSPPPPRDNNNIKGWKKEEKSEGKTSHCPHTLTDSWSLGNAAQTLCRSDVGQTQRQISWNKKTPVPHHLQMIMAGKTPFQNNDSGRRDEKRKSSLLYLQRWQSVRDVRDVKAH